jgi:hypothetical protein
MDLGVGRTPCGCPFLMQNASMSFRGKLNYNHPMTVTELHLMSFLLESSDDFPHFKLLSFLLSALSSPLTSPISPNSPAGSTHAVP